MTRFMRVVSPAAFAVALLLIATPPARTADAASRASLTGKWTVTLETPQGSRDSEWNLEQHDDGSLTGTVGGQMGEAEIRDGHVGDDSFEFGITRDFNGQSFEISYRGNFTEDELSGTLTAGGGQFTAEFSGVRAQ